MSLRYALIGLLATEPASGYDLSKRFSESMAHVWPAGHGQIYPELARLTADGLIAQTGDEGPRGRRTYAATDAGVATLRSWLQDTEPDYSCRSDADLRDFFLWALSPTEAVEHLDRDVAAYRLRRGQLAALATAVDWDTNVQTRVLKLTLEKGLRHYDMQIDWAIWAAEQIAGGALESAQTRATSGAAVRPVTGHR